MSPLPQKARTLRSFASGATPLSADRANAGVGLGRAEQCKAKGGVWDKATKTCRPPGSSVPR